VSVSIDANTKDAFAKPAAPSQPRWKLRTALSFALISSGAIWLVLGLILKLALSLR
jgi:hypothetical protein